MKKDTGLSRLVYDYFETRILFGRYLCGDRLPSIPQISEIFHLSCATVRAALACLESEGYISLEARKTAVILYQSDPDCFQEKAAQYYVPRKEGIRDLGQSGKYLFIPIWKEALRQWENKQMEYRKGLKQDVPMPIEIYTVFRILDNRLLLNLYGESLRYIRFLFLMKKFGEEWEGIAGERSLSSLDREFSNIYHRLEEKVSAFIDASTAAYGMGSGEQVPFRWDIYRQRPQLRYSLAAEIIQEVMAGGYAIGSYLPTLPEMEKKYNVSLTTVRRTLKILRLLGVIRSYHGKGTQVCMEPVEIDFTLPEIREGLRLYRESLQVLSLTVREIMLYTLEAVSMEACLDLTGQLSKLQRDGRSFLCFEALLRFIYEKCPLAAVRECYGRLAGLTAWGYPFMLSRRQGKPLDLQYAGMVKQMEHHLRAGDKGSFSESCQRLFEQEGQYCMQLAGPADGQGCREPKNNQLGLGNRSRKQ